MITAVVILQRMVSNCSIELTAPRLFEDEIRLCVDDLETLYQDAIFLLKTGRSGATCYLLLYMYGRCRDDTISGICNILESVETPFTLYWVYRDLRDEDDTAAVINAIQTVDMCKGMLIHSTEENSCRIHLDESHLTELTMYMAVPLRGLPGNTILPSSLLVLDLTLVNWDCGYTSEGDRCMDAHLCSLLRINRLQQLRLVTGKISSDFVSTLKVCTSITKLGFACMLSGAYMQKTVLDTLVHASPQLCTIYVSFDVGPYGLLHHWSHAYLQSIVAAATSRAEHGWLHKFDMIIRSCSGETFADFSHYYPTGMQQQRGHTRLFEFLAQGRQSSDLLVRRSLLGKVVCNDICDLIMNKR